MVYLNPEQVCLVELLKAALFDKSPKFPDLVNWNHVFELANAQCVVPLVASNVPLEYRDDWLKVTYQSKTHYMQMLYEQNALIKMFNEKTIPLVILKGTAAAIYYKNPVLRTFGDIDIYISEGFEELSIKLLEDNGFSSAFNNDRHYVFEKNGIIFELHTSFCSHYFNNVEHIFITGLNNAVEYEIGLSKFPGLPTYENGIILIGHIMQHLKDFGIGLRQIIDWMMFVHKELDDSAWEKHFKKMAVEAGLERLAITVTYMCKMWLGLPDDITWCNNADEKVADQLLLRVLEDGNFGRERALSEKVGKAMKEKGIFPFLQEDGMAKWRLAQKYSVFKPFAWLYQLSRYAFKGIKGIFTKEKVFKENKTISLEELLKQLE